MVKARIIGTSTVTVQGQITILKELRDRLKLKPGDVVEFLLTENGHIVVRRLDVKEEIEL